MLLFILIVIYALLTETVITLPSLKKNLKVKHLNYYIIAYLVLGAILIISTFIAPPMKQHYLPFIVIFFVIVGGFGFYRYER
ncbi:hypothetical protein [Lapidilactobacillus wuchangensis]|uniref:hypothetical protein n=1 Tax=Lapidilactobacillus wuchangensis TaxID=2486001 RepID=UPI000F7A00EA|nr:hypothetical protein [Lapidilactobacillus wuchangensis]